LLPVGLAAIEQAIRLNGSFVEGNLRLFGLGRLAAHAPDALAREMGGEAEAVPLATLDDVLASRMRLLTAYQNAAYANGYRDFMTGLHGRVAARRLEGVEEFLREAALTLARLMAYKDYYEVARLYTDPGFARRLRDQFSGDFKLTFHLAPPFLPGQPRKREFGRGTMALFKLLAALKGLRGTPFDLFGYSPERRLERRLIEEYRDLVSRIADRLGPTNLTAGIELARAASEVRGYGPVKLASITAYETRLEALLRNFDAASAPPHARVA